MTPKEKAEELVVKMSSSLDFVKINLNSKKCALIAVNEMLDELSNEDMYLKSNYLFWEKVKQEIEVL